MTKTLARVISVDQFTRTNLETFKLLALFHSSLIQEQTQDVKMAITSFQLNLVLTKIFSRIQPSPNHHHPQQHLHHKMFSFGIS
jgi:hypothetical protein